MPVQIIHDECIIPWPEDAARAASAAKGSALPKTSGGSQVSLLFTAFSLILAIIASNIVVEIKLRRSARRGSCCERGGDLTLVRSKLAKFADHDINLGR